MRRALTVAVVVVATAVGGATAEAAVKKGTFRGATEAGDPIGLKVNRSNKFFAFFFDGVRLRCSDGDTVNTPRIVTPDREKFTIGSQRNWGIAARNRRTGFGWDAEGKFGKKGGKVTGTLTVFATFNDQNQQDPNGSVRCTSGELDFTARRQ
jgi:hypothetical protein